MKKSFILLIVLFVIAVLFVGCKKTESESGSSSAFESIELKAYKIGDIGPSGGYVFYDCDADNDVEYTTKNGTIKTNKDGLMSSECGWRYLEAAPEDLDFEYVFGYYRTIDKVFSMKSDMSDTEVGTSEDIGTGKANTEVLVNTMGETAYVNYYINKYEESSYEKGAYAAKACADYSITVDGIVYDDWFLPSEDELHEVYLNLYKNGLGSIAEGCYYWSSSEYDKSKACCHYIGDSSYLSINFSPNKQEISNECVSLKYEYCRVRPVRAFTACVDSANHIWDSGVVAKAATCVSDGVRTFTCTVCGQTKKEVIRATNNHSYVDYKCSVCGIWGNGPSGGYVFYDCDADNDVEYTAKDGTKKTNEDGLTSSVCGWRFLEAAPNDLSDKYCFGYSRSSNNSGSRLITGTKNDIGEGKTNTEILIKVMGETAYEYSSETEGTERCIYAAKACADYSVNVEGVVYDGWFLPSKDELNLMYENLQKNELGSFAYLDYYWSSSEGSGNGAWVQSFSSGTQYSFNRSGIDYVRPVRAFK